MECIHCYSLLLGNSTLGSRVVGDLQIILEFSEADTASCSGNGWCNGTLKGYPLFFAAGIFSSEE